MLNHFEYIGIILTLEAKLQEYDKHRQAHADNGHSEDLAEKVKESEFVKAQLYAGRMEGLMAALIEIKKLEHK
jgi:hypothetical protein